MIRPTLLAIYAEQHRSKSLGDIEFCETCRRPWPCAVGNLLRERTELVTVLSSVRDCASNQSSMLCELCIERIEGVLGE